MKKYILITFILITGLCYGANEIRAYYASSNTLYAAIRNGSGQAFDTTNNVFEVWNVMTDYDISLTDKSGGMYVGDFDTDASAGEYTLMIYNQAGGSPADSDPPVMFEEGYWDGTYWHSTTGRLEDIHGDTNELQTDDVPTLISNLNDFDPSNDTVAHVTLVDTTTTNTDMRGTDGANTTVPDAAGTAAALHATTDALIADVNDNIIAEFAGITVDNGAIADEVVIHMDANSADFNTIIADTNELQTDWTNGGRLDLILDSIKKYTDLTVILETDVNDANDATQFTVTDGNDTADFYNGYMVLVQDAGDSQWEARFIEDWGTDLEIVVSSPFNFTPASNDLVYIMGFQYFGNMWHKIQTIGTTMNVINNVDTTKNRGVGTVIFDVTGD